MKINLIFRQIAWVAVLGFLATVAKAEGKRKTVYVWDFKTPDRHLTERTSFITEEFEDALKDVGFYRFVDRRDGDRMQQQAILEGRVSVTNISQIGEDGRKALRLENADLVIFGKVYEDTASRHVTVKVDFENWNKEIEISDYIDIERIEDQATRRVAMADLAKKLYADALREKELGDSDATETKENIADTDWKPAGNFSFRLIKCSAMRTQVNIALQVKVNDGDDHLLYVGSEQHGGIASGALRTLGACSIIDSEGVTYMASVVEFAKQRSDETGQSWFKVFAETQPTMNLVFENVSLKATSVRLDLSVGDATGANGPSSIRGLPVQFKNLKIEGRDNK